MMIHWHLLQSKLDALTEEFEAFRQTSMQMTEAKDAEVAKILESNARLREELSAAMSGNRPVARVSSNGATAASDEFHVVEISPVTCPFPSVSSPLITFLPVVADTTMSISSLSPAFPSSFSGFALRRRGYCYPGEPHVATPAPQTIWQDETEDTLMGGVEMLLVNLGGEMQEEVAPTEEWETWAKGSADGAPQDRQEAGLLEEMLTGPVTASMIGESNQLLQIAQRQVIYPPFSLPPSLCCLFSMSTCCLPPPSSSGLTNEAWQARRDEELAEAKRKASEMEGELLELRKEVQLREEQERVLKEALRDIESKEAREKITKSVRRAWG